jgi:hypothetical protein
MHGIPPPTIGPKNMTPCLDDSEFKTSMRLLARIGTEFRACDLLATQHSLTAKLIGRAHSHHINSTQLRTFPWASKTFKCPWLMLWPELTALSTGEKTGRRISAMSWQCGRSRLVLQKNKKGSPSFHSRCFSTTEANTTHMTIFSLGCYLHTWYRIKTFLAPVKFHIPSA